MSIGDFLARYQPHMISERHRDLTEEVLSWLLHRCTCARGPAWHARSAFFGAAFGACCAPADGTLRECLPAAKYTAFFFSLDDLPSGAFPDLTFLQVKDAPTAPADEFAALYQDLLHDLGAHHPMLAQFRTETADTCAAMLAETRLDIAGLSPDQFHALRCRTIGTFPYITCWRIVRNLPPPDPDDPLVERAVEAVYITNDLASLTRDSRPAVDGEPPTVLNLITFHSRHSSDRDRAIDAAIARYNHIIEQLGWGHGALAQLLGSIVQGNADGHLHLAAIRWPGATEILQRLHPYSVHVPDESTP